MKKIKKKLRKLRIYINNYIFKPKPTLLQKLSMSDYKVDKDIKISLNKIDFSGYKISKELDTFKDLKTSKQKTHIFSYLSLLISKLKFFNNKTHK